MKDNNKFVFKWIDTIIEGLALFILWHIYEYAQLGGWQPGFYGAFIYALVTLAVIVKWIKMAIELYKAFPELDSSKNYIRMSLEDEKDD